MITGSPSLFPATVPFSHIRYSYFHMPFMYASSLLSESLEHARVATQLSQNDLNEPAASNKLLFPVEYLLPTQHLC